MPRDSPLERPVAAEYMLLGLASREDDAVEVEVDISDSLSQNADGNVT